MTEKDIICTWHKDIIVCDYHIDDAIHNLENGYGIKILYDTPHNKGDERFIRMSCWKDIYEFILDS